MFSHVSHLAQAETLLASNEADLLAIGSQFLYEPRWVWRAANELLGNSEKVPLSISVLHHCLSLSIIVFSTFCRFSVRVVGLIPRYNLISFCGCFHHCLLNLALAGHFLRCIITELILACCAF